MILGLISYCNKPDLITILNSSLCPLIYRTLKLANVLLHQPQMQEDMLTVSQFASSNGKTVYMYYFNYGDKKAKFYM